MTRSLDHVVKRAERAVHELEADLFQIYGWTHVHVEFAIDVEQRVLRARGTVVAPRVARELAAAIADALPDDFRFDARGVKPLRTGEWHSLPDGVTAVWQKHPSRGLALATELLPGDGPVELLTLHDGVRLVRSMDGTLGWVERELGGRRAPAGIAPAHGTGDQVLAAARGLSDAPYRLGGTTIGGVDCSGLCQRAYREGLGVLLPRHSLDQLAATIRFESSPRRTGDLVFVWSEREGPCHVGILSASEKTSVIHASLSRKQVVEDPWEHFVDQASRIELCAISHALDYHARNVGRPNLEIAPGWEEP